MLHPWQNELVRWAVHTSRAALWADTGMGKTMMQLEWARLSRDHGALIIAPLAVCQQTIREAVEELEWEHKDDRPEVVWHG